MAMLRGTTRTGMTLAINGCGNIGTAILSGLLNSCNKIKDTGKEPRFTNFIACVNSQGSVDRLNARFKEYSEQLTVLRNDNVTAMQKADVVLLGFKPYMTKKILTADGVQRALRDKLVISVVAGTPVEKVKSFIGKSDSESDCHVVRGVINIAAEFGESMSLIEEVEMPEDLTELTEWIFSQLGKTVTVTPDLFDITGVLSGPSGVLISVALDGILDGAVSQGLKRSLARTMVSQSLIGLAKLLEAGNTPDVLREKFASPKGTTIDGLLSLEEDRVRFAFSKAVIKTAHKSHSMSIADSDSH